MGSTTSSKRKKEEPKKEVEIPVAQEIVPVKGIAPEDMPQYLSKEHLLLLEGFDKDIQNARLSMALEEQILQNQSLNLELLKRDIESQKGKLQLKATEYNQQVTKFEEIKKTVWPQYGFRVEEGMGYNPLSGKISR